MTLPNCHPVFLVSNTGQELFWWGHENMLHDTMPTSVSEMQKQGFVPLGAEQLRAHLMGKCFFGVFRSPFTYTMKFSPDGTLWGRNNYGTEDSGHGVIDETSDTLTVSWNKYWEAHTTQGYLVDKSIHMFDAYTGEWRTTLLKEISESELTTLKL